jgi:hypothetical protein
MKQEEKELRKRAASFLRKIADNVDSLNLKEVHRLTLDGSVLLAVDTTGLSEVINNLGIISQDLGDD